MLLPMIAELRFKFLDLENILALPLVIICLYAVFRWRKFGEDAYTWNHEYFRRAFAIGLLVWIVLFGVTWFTEPWQKGVCWLVFAVLALLFVHQWSEPEWPRAGVLALMITLVGLAFMVAPQWIRRAIYHPVKMTLRSGRSSLLAGVPVTQFVFQPPEGWHEILGESPHKYRRSEPKSGILQVSLLPPFDKAIQENGERAEQELTRMMDELNSQLDIGQRVSASHETCATGIMASVQYASATHGLTCYWLIPTTSATVYASYTEPSHTAPDEIMQLNLALKTIQVQSN